ncbi:MAG TPA: hypothetical protein VGQ59_16725 [Cyclobacteriaceae bacterium]|jgi:hypothetical protein|nr:hypothetical protein [Cyclobacteriaceae bacterium]
MTETTTEEKLKNQTSSLPVTLCFDIRFFGNEKEADKYLVEQFHRIKEKLSAMGLTSLHETINRIEHGDSISFRKRVHVQAHIIQPDWNIAKSIIRECFNTGCYFVDFLRKPKTE